jgi:hypothetical protein
MRVPPPSPLPPQLLPASLTRLALPGVALDSRAELAALGRLSGLTRLEVRSGPPLREGHPDAAERTAAPA